VNMAAEVADDSTLSGLLPAHLSLSLSLSWHLHEAFTVLDLLCVWTVHHLGVVHDGGYLLRVCGIEIEQMVGFF
jgi:hypothetical protein